MSPEERRRDRRLILAIALLSMLPFVAVLTAGFVWDDHPQIEANDRLTLENLGGLWLRGEADTLEVGRAARYNPLGWSLYTLEGVASGGARPAWLYHATSLLMHGLGSGLLAALLLALGRAGGTPRPRLLAAIGAGWFAVAPVQAEVVCFVAARFDSLAWVLLGGGLLIAVRGATPRVMLLGGLLAASSMLSKEATLTALGLAPVALPWLIGRREGDRAFAAGAWGGAAVVMLARHLVGIEAPGGVAGAGRLLANLASLARVSVLQENLSLMRPIPTSPGAVDLLVLGAVVLVGVLGWSARHSFEGRLVAVGAAWFAALLVPHAAAAVGFELMPDRYCYLAVPGLAMVVAGAATARPVRGLLPALVLLGVLFVVRDVAQMGRWQDDIALFSWEVERFPEAPQTAYMLGMALRNEGLVDLAEEQLVESTRLGPELPQTWGELAELRAEQGDIAGARAAIEEGLSHLPGHPELVDMRQRLSALPPASSAPGSAP